DPRHGSRRAPAPRPPDHAPALQRHRGRQGRQRTRVHVRRRLAGEEGRGDRVPARVEGAAAHVPGARHRARHDDQAELLGSPSVSGAEVVVSSVSKAFEGGRITALANASLRLAPGELVALTGPSGSGKSTLLNLIGALDRPDSGTISVDGAELDGVDTTAYRAETVGLIFQFHHLIPTVSALDNVQVPMLGRGLGRASREQQA